MSRQKAPEEADTSLRGKRIISALHAAITTVAEGTGAVSVLRLRILREEQEDKPLTLVIVAEGDQVHTGIKALLDACVPDETQVRGYTVRRPEPVQ